MRLALCIVISLALCARPVCPVNDTARFQQAAENGKQFDRIPLCGMQRLLHAWLKGADPRTPLLPDRLLGGRGMQPGENTRLCTPHNSGADPYPYLILTAHLTDPDIYYGRMAEMLRNEVRYTTAKDSIPGNLDLTARELGPLGLTKEAAGFVREGCARTLRLADVTHSAYNQPGSAAEA